MHVFLSDLHLTDGQLGSPVPDQELEAFCQGELAALCQSKKLELVLLGDIVDLLRSSKWAELWDQKNQAAPWRAQSPSFKNFVGDYSEQTALEVLQGIVARYPKFSAALKALTQANKVNITYVIGNHDYIAQLSPKVRNLLCDFLSVTHDRTKPFLEAYVNEEASVYATHGQRFDPINRHDQAAGHWALGDAVVLRIVNRFAIEACKNLKISETSRLGRQFHELDNIEPLYDLPIYIRWLTDDFLSADGDKAAVRLAWTKVVAEFVADPILSDPKIYGGKEHKQLRDILWLTLYDSLTDLLNKVASSFGGADKYHHEATQLAKAHDGTRFVVFGHTHGPKLMPLAHTVGNQPAFYINTGCWRRVALRPSRKVAGPFVSVRVASYFRIDDAGADPESSRYHLRQQWHVT